MSIRTRMTLWYGGVLFLSAGVIAWLSFKELGERREEKEDPTENLADIAGIACWIGIPALILSVGGGWLLMRKAMAPIAALTSAAERTHDRNLGEQLPRSGNGDELDHLAEVFNAMTARLNESFGRIRQFTLHASHELKTPLTVMRGELEMALRDETLSLAHREAVLSQMDEVERLSRIVDGLTLLTRADAGQITLRLEPVRFDDLVREACADTRILSEPQGLKVELGSCPELVVNGDRHRLRQLLLNLADNAIKYNQPGGTISMALTRESGSAVYSLANTGPGIAPDALPRVFDRFFRGDPSHSHEIDGCGLGLSIAHWIVSAHNGSIQIESMPEKPTIVTVRLPVARDKNDD